jgi:hypothetical protein
VSVNPIATCRTCGDFGHMASEHVSVQWDGLDFAAIQMATMDHRHRGAPAATWNADRTLWVRVHPDITEWVTAGWWVNVTPERITVTTKGPRMENERMSTTGQEQTELAELEAEFEAAGGRGADLADRIDELRLKLYPGQYPELVQAAAEAAAEEFPPG